MTLRSFLYPQKLAERTSRFNRKIEVIEANGTTQLLVNGIVQTGMYTHALLKRGLGTLATWHKGPMMQALVFGIGGGDVFIQLQKQYPNIHITGVDIDAAIIDLACAHFGLNNIETVGFVQSDARKYVIKKRKSNELFDCVIIDIYIGNDVPSFVTTRQFLRAVCRMIRSEGSVLINYFSFSGQKEKSASLLGVLEKIFSGVKQENNHRNIFYYCRR